MLTVLAEAAKEPDHTIFYVVGGLLAAFAVVLSFIGLTRPDFPGGTRGGRLVMGLTVVMFVATLTSAVVSSAH